MSKCLLALETSGRSGSVALLLTDDCHLDPSQTPTSYSIDAEVLDPNFGSAKTLAPAIHKLLARHDLPTHALNAVALIHGPGSFTGLRVGVATAKALAYALKIPIVAVDGLSVIAHQVANAWAATAALPQRPLVAAPRLMAVVDAYRGQSFCGEFRLGCVDPGEENSNATDTGRINAHAPLNRAITLQPTGIADNDLILGRLMESGTSDWIVAGPGVAKLRKHAESASPGALELATWETTEISLPHATTVATLGWHRWQAGQLEDAWSLLPMYYRSSAAEEKASSDAKPSRPT